MDAEIIAVGSELLTPKRVDTNSLYLTDQLNLLGVEVVMKSVVGDDLSRLTKTVRSARARSGIVILTGGLGPTEDDLTREAVAAALGREQIFHPEICESIEKRFQRMNRPMAEINKRQAFVIEGAEILPNPRGTAPGQWVEDSGVILLLLPGPPNELEPMFTRHCLPRFMRVLPKQVIQTRVLRVTGMPESDLDQLISPIYRKYENPVTTVLAAPGDIQIHLRARCATTQEAEALLAEVGDPIEGLLGDKIYSRNGEPLEKVVGDLLRARNATLSVAESCTAGLLASRVTAAAGSSDYFLGGFLVYSDQVKRELLGVDPRILDEHGAVSEQAAEAMAVGTRQRTGTTLAVSITGIAGPGGASPHSPVGTVYIGLEHADGCSACEYHFLGDRARVRALAVQAALDLLRRFLQ